MELLIFFIILSIGVSFLCSILEAVLLSLTPGYLESLRTRDSKTFKKLKPLKDHIEKPLSAILSLNTIAHTVGATGAGAQAQILFSNNWVTLFSVIFTLAILIFSEIIPKSIGARYWKSLLHFSSGILPVLVFISYPLVWVSNEISKLIKGGKEEGISREEVKAIASLGLHNGSLSKDEFKALDSILSFPNEIIRSITKKKKDLYYLDYNMSFDEAFNYSDNYKFSRFPVIGRHQNDIRGYILRHELLRAKALGLDIELKELIKPCLIAPDTEKIRTVFLKLIKRREHIAAVINEASDFIGIITLEDIIENMLDLDIKDETDNILVSDS